MEKQTLSSPYVIIVPLLLDPSEYNLVQRPVPVHHQYAQRLMMPESGITPTVSSDNQQTRTNFVDVFCTRCIHDRLAFNVAARRSCGSY